jgi:hypothetical protein
MHVVFISSDSLAPHIVFEQTCLKIGCYFKIQNISIYIYIYFESCVPPYAHIFTSVNLSQFFYFLFKNTSNKIVDFKSMQLRYVYCIFQTICILNNKANIDSEIYVLNFDLGGGTSNVSLSTIF